MCAAPSTMHAKNSGAIEDAFVQWLVPRLEALGFDVIVTPEFRRADVLLSRSSWPVDVYHGSLWVVFALFVSSLSEGRSRPPALRERAASNSMKGTRGCASSQALRCLGCVPTTREAV